MDRIRQRSKAQSKKSESEGRNIDRFPASYNLVRWNRTEEKSCSREINKDPTTTGMLKALMKQQFAHMRTLSATQAQSLKMNARDDQMVEVITSQSIMNNRVANLEVALGEIKAMLANIPAGAGPAAEAEGHMDFQLPVTSTR